jgi:hypothetical protein
MEPSAWIITIGILFHHWEDFSLAVVFLSLLGRGPRVFGEIQLMLNNQGLPAVRSGVHALFARFGEHESDRAEPPRGR